MLQKYLKCLLAHLGIVLPGAASWAAALSGYFFWLTWQCKEKHYYPAVYGFDHILLLTSWCCVLVLDAPMCLRLSFLFLFIQLNNFFFIYISFWSSSLFAIYFSFKILFLFSFDFLHYLLIILFKPNFWFLLHFPLKITQAFLLSFPQKPPPIFCTSLFAPFKELFQSHLLISQLIFCFPYLA